jgi:membrane associated rhomboid family serine protease
MDDVPNFVATQDPPPPAPREPVAVRDLKPVDSWRPWVTYALIAVNVAAFIYELGKGASVSGATPQQMIDLGGDFAVLTRNGQPWRLVTSMFLHYGVIHIGMNMLCLYQVRVVERMVGHAEFLALYFATGVLSGVASITRQPHAVSAGASGAVFGVFGVFTAVMIVRRAKFDPQVWSRTMTSLGTFFALNLFIGLTATSIDMTAHVVGLIAGFVGGAAIAWTQGRTGRPALRAAIVAIVGGGIAIGVLFAIPPTKSAEPLLAEYDAIHNKTLTRFNELFEQWTDKSQPNPQFAEAIERDMVAPFEALRAKFKAFPREEVPERARTLFSDFEDYLGARVAWWRQVEQLARTPDPLLIHDTNDLRDRADAELEKINQEIRDLKATK